MGAIVVLSGPIGAGKTTVAKALMESAQPPAAYIEGDDFWRFLVKPAKPHAPANFQTIMRAMFRASAALAGDGYEVLLDFSMPPGFLERAAARLADTAVHFVVLRPSLEVCADRAATRSEGVIADYAPYRDLYAMFDVAERHIIANDAKDPTDVASEIRSGLGEGRFGFP